MIYPIIFNGTCPNPPKGGGVLRLENTVVGDGYGLQHQSNGFKVVSIPNGRVATESVTSGDLFLLCKGDMYNLSVFSPEW